MKLKHLSAAAALCLALAQPALAAPGDMNVATFLMKATALKTRGMAALFSPDVGLLKSEVQGAVDLYRAQLKVERAENRASSCPPSGGIKLNSDQLLAHLNRYPEAQRGQIPLKQAMRDYMIKTYPCR